ncbi:CDP-alcohol phosphatidyltransferase family protein [Campylobacter lari]|uniref:CDP-alcohol phosphatidyltransferase family protein n=1 Tax=Campylobacter sp. W0066.1 TaxID=2735751 RepID=UPI00126DB301|nr:CDP-alcohol phosphatidyltransferase family protein [Campylobacter lari]MCR8712978.1 CDP-alcohol phosphatidyltransferase family protein [Campylobacter sp. W0066.1]EAK9857037.1 CDP-alcohol phosphatidyltransferase family protein [Campylobacter lari]EAL5741283.1 CDP-alcohol phosphatidyltransferase family protein [Campylobacter lari]EGG0462972.1 CDP-alcohol phosphatidyltransferase family protein [Campylobacter lari]
MNLDEKLKKRQRLEMSYYPTEYIIRVLLLQKYILIPISKTSITPNHITISSLVLIVISFLAIYNHFTLLAGILYFVYCALDCLDGMLARYKDLRSQFGSYLDKVVDHIGFNGVFIMAYIASYISLFECCLAIICMNLHRTICPHYILKNLRKVKNIKRFGVKKYFLERGFLLGIDATLLVILISIGLIFNIFSLICYLLSFLFIFDLAYRFFELRYNLKHNED